MIKKQNVPELRFPEFLNDGEWEEKPLSELLTIGNGKDYKHLSNGEIPVYGTGGYMLSVNDYLYNGESVCIGRKGTIDKPMFLTGKFWTVDTLFYTHSFKHCIPKYIFYNFGTINWYNHNEAGGVPSLSKATINKINIPVPPKNGTNEQQKIADCLSSMDSLITAQSQKVELLKEHKKGLMQNLFPQEGENIPRLRFPEFVNDGEWEEKKLGDLLDYEQPTNYLVSDTNYNDKFKTPVLTAGKTFILGYTNETSGVFDNPLPVIIFDDFTTATQFVDFPFKAKSSAMKILKPKSSFANMKIIFELMQNINYQAEEHKRYWISEYQNIEVKIPKPNEQQKIADCLSSLDEQINQQISKLQTLKEHKKALMQGLFPKST